MNPHRFLLLILCLILLNSVVTLKCQATSNDPVIELTPKNFKSLVLDSQETWMVEFYAPWCGHCKALAPHWKQAASKLNGIVKFGAVDADKHRQLGQKYNVKGFPTIKIFKGIGVKARRPSDYQGERTAKALEQFAKTSLPSFVAIIKNDGMNAFFNEDSSLPHAILFTEKSKTSPIMKALSLRHFGNISMGEVRKKDGNALIKSFGVTQFPTLLVFPPHSSAIEDAIRFENDLARDQLSNKIESILSGNLKFPKDAGNHSESASVGEEREQELSEDTVEQIEIGKRVIEQPKAHSTEMFLLKSKDEYVRECGERVDGKICVLMIYSRGINSELETELNGICEKYKFDQVVFTKLDISSSLQAKEFAEILVQTKLNDSEIKLMAVRSRKNRLNQLEMDDSLTASMFTSYLDRLISGDLRYNHNIPKNLPEWNSIEKIEL